MYILCRQESGNINRGTSYRKAAYLISNFLKHKKETRLSRVKASINSLIFRWDGTIEFFGDVAVVFIEAVVMAV